MQPLGFTRLLTGTLSLLVASVAHAGPVERMADIAVHPSKPDVMVLRYVNGGTGLLYTTDGGQNFRLLCASAIDTDKPTGPITISGDGRVLMGEFDGLWQDNGEGCEWSKPAPLENRWITDLAADPANEARVLAVSGNGDPGAKNGISRRDESGQWTDVGSRDEINVTRVRATKTSSGVRIYESAIRVQTTGDGGVPEAKYLIRVSDDEGSTWKENEVAVTNGSFRLEVIDPTNPDRIVGSISRTSTPDELLVSRDQGATFTSYGELTEVGALVMAPDGRIWAGEPQNVMMASASRGLWFAESLDAPLAKVSDMGVECLAYLPQSDSLVGCQAYSFGKFNSTTWQFTEMFHFRNAKEFVKCGGTDVAAMCEVQMCLDYCGAGHFAQAILCCAYDTPACGPSIAEMEGTGTRSMCTGLSTDGGMSMADGGAAGSAGAAAGSGGSGGSGGATAGASGAAGSITKPPEGDQDDGCSCRAAGASPQSSRSLLWLALLLIAVPRLGRHTRRATAARRASETSR
ncbi:MAG TPA: hypothetical protein VFG30_37525 [Polyangiales bacterium]|nr:hypothetical protein [Polyangiales bacterium]